MATIEACRISVELSASSPNSVPLVRVDTSLFSSSCVKSSAFVNLQSRFCSRSVRTKGWVPTIRQNLSGLAASAARWLPKPVGFFVAAFLWFSYYFCEGAAGLSRVTFNTIFSPVVCSLLITYRLTFFTNRSTPRRYGSRSQSTFSCTL